MYINMTPDKSNKTLHASQDDTTRQFKFKLVNDSQVLDTSDSIPPVIYDVEPNGIEQLLPVNSSTPTTSPIIADIQYPDELRENQEFFERITPTTLKGQAKVEKIKGNTIVWNQLVQNGNFVDTSNWYARDNATLTVSNNVGTLVTTNANISAIVNRFSYVQGHKYLIKLSVKSSSGQTLGVGLTNNNGSFREPYMSINPTSSWAEYSVIGTATNSPSGNVGYDGLVIRNNNSAEQTVELKNVQVFDLTQMFGAGNEPSLDEFKALFPLDYYDYNAGSLLSFNGTGIKTIGKNLAQNDNATNQNRGSFSYTSETLQRVKCTKTANGGLFYFKLKARLKANTVYKLSVGDANVNGSTQVNFYIYSDVLWGNAIYTGNVRGNSFRSLSFTEDYGDAVIGFYVSGAPGIDIEVNDIMLTFEDTDTSVFEPYTESTTSLPISTYFPNGMKSAGSAYDELTKNKATTRIGMIDLGTLSWVSETSATGSNVFWGGNTIPLVRPSSSSKANVVCGRYTTELSNSVYRGEVDKAVGVSDSGTIRIRDTSFSDANTFKQSLSGVYLYYELATPTEEDIESYSLVSDGIEKPLEYDNGFLVCESNGLTSKAGFIPCKVKKVKGDQTIYSQLINLHVERKP